MSDKEKLEMMNLRRRLIAQRAEIKRLQEEVKKLKGNREEIVRGEA